MNVSSVGVEERGWLAFGIRFEVREERKEGLDWVERGEGLGEDGEDGGRTRNDNSNICFGFRSPSINRSFLLQIDRPYPRLARFVLYLKFEDSVHLFEHSNNRTTIRRKKGREEEGQPRSFELVLGWAEEIGSSGLGKRHLLDLSLLLRFR